MIFSYQDKVKTDSTHWIEQGWVSEDNAENILRDIASRGARFSFANVLAMLGALLLCFGAVTFVAANWPDISKLWRLIILFTALWAAYGAAIYLKARGMPIFSEAALLIGIGVFGASIMLISQTYHIEGHGPDAVWLWALGALVTAIACRSRAALSAFFVLITIWSCWEIGDRFSMNATHLHWQFLLAWTLGAVLAFYAKWRPNYHLAVISFLIWLFVSIEMIAETHELGVSTALLLAYQIGLVIAALGCVAGSLSGEVRSFAKPLTAYGFLALLLFAIGLQFAPGLIASNAKHSNVLPALLPAFVPLGLFALAWQRKNLARIDLIAGAGAIALPLLLSATFPQSDMVQAAFIFALTIWAIRFGWRQKSRAVTVLGYIAFGVELLYIYFEIFGSLLDTAIFYLIAGGLLLALALGFMRLEAMSKKREG